MPIPSEKLEKFVAWPGIEPGSPANMTSALTTELPNYTVCDLSMGYHQLELHLHTESRDLSAIVLPRGKYRYTCMPQGAGPSSDLFNIHTVPQLRGQSGIYKDVNGILTAGPTPGQLEEKMEAVLKVCGLKHNMKLSPSKFECAHIRRSHN